MMLTEEQIEALAWALNKLRAFGVDSNSPENAEKMDRLWSLLHYGD